MRLGDGLGIEARVGDGWDVLFWTTHWFDLANFLFGTPPLYVLAGAQVSDKRIYGHAGLGAWPDWAEYRKWCGYVWEWGVSIHTHAPVTLPPEASGNFHFCEAWLPRDEVFIRLKETAPVILDLIAQCG